jgi:hypothetical protein
MKRFTTVLLGLGLAVAACTPPKPAETPDEAATETPADSSGSSSTGSSGSGSSNPGSINVPGPAMPGGGGKGNGPSNGPVAKGSVPGEAPNAPGVGALLEGGIRWGMSKDEVVKAHTAVNGIIWKDYDSKLAHASVGPQMKALEQQRDASMRAFERTWVEFDTTPTGYDATGLKSEYTYRNKEALLQLQRDGKTRYFFFINNRLWKIYDAVPLGDSGPMGKTFADAVNTMNGKLGVQGRIVAPDPAAGRTLTLVDWRDSSSHMRLVDRGAENIAGVVVEDLSTLNNLASLRSVKESNPLEIDPTIAAVTKGDNRVDPNAPGAASDPKKDPKKDGKKDPKKK